MHDLTKPEYKIMEIDPYLHDYASDIDLRMQRYNNIKSEILKTNKSIKTFANGHLFFGFHKLEHGFIYREWAPNADSLALIGDFNNWDNTKHKLTKSDDNSYWSVLIDSEDLHMSKVKVQIIAGGETHDRIPLYIRRAVQDENGIDFSGQVWQPNESFIWTDDEFALNKKEALLIYECHIGMAQEKLGIGTFKEFEENILPWIKQSGYNTIQLMAVAEHPYYASFGYHVSNFFAVCSRFGTPDDLKSLINSAHKLGISVLMDIVHSHSVKNTNEGINKFDGTTEQFFLAGDRGEHPAWGSKIFNYGKIEVVHFLLSNIKYWMQEYHFDGFRFDGVTSMIYEDHGLGSNFDNYKKYFSLNTNIDALNYLQLANELIKSCNRTSISIAEDMSGMPGMALKIKDGGIGFDYRLSMGVPDFWKNTLEVQDENWDMYKLWHELTTRRPQEKTIGYCESHDQALVGDKTIIFKLADKEMYDKMQKSTQSIIIDRAIALDNLIKAITISLSGEGYLNFMGNEFGHPEWIDFPREGNDSSYKFARRQWSLAKNSELKFEYIYNFDKQFTSFIKTNKIMQSKKLELINIDNNNKLIVFKKEKNIFVFNFNPVNSYSDFFVETIKKGDYKVAFSSDIQEFGGTSRINTNIIYKAYLNLENKKTGIKIYSPSRTLIVLSK